MDIDVANSVKNCILFVLMILILHFVAKAQLETGNHGNSAGGRSAGHRPQNDELFQDLDDPVDRQAARKSPPPPPAPEKDLLEYVFGGSSSPSSVDKVNEKVNSTANEKVNSNAKVNVNDIKNDSKNDSKYDSKYDSTKKPTSVLIKETMAAEPPLKPKKSCPLSPDDNHNGLLVVGKYDNETTMCGGKLFDGVLQGFESGGSMYQTL